MFFRFEGFTRRNHNETTWSCEGIHDVWHQHFRHPHKGELLLFEPSSNTLLDGSLFHCCFLLVVYMIHLANGGATLEIGSMDLHIEERSHLLDAPSNLHSCHDVEHWYTNTSIFVDCAHTCHARWTYHTHHKFAPYAWIDSHYACLVASISMSSMIYELVHFLRKFVVIYLDGIFIHHDHIVHHQLHDSLHILSIQCHIHAIDKPSHYDIILHPGCIDHIVTSPV